jgi:cardiolipin synthase (CMP-forming)
MFKNKIPNILTIARLILIPVIVISFYLPWKITNLIVATLFLVASVTDYFDGYLARSMHAQSNFGKCLDPIADKLLVAVALIMLIHFNVGNLFFTIPAMIIICREILVSGLREFLATFNVSVPVTKLSKWKTGIQMTAITLLLLAGNGSEYMHDEIMNFVEASIFIRINLYNMILTLGEILLIIASILTIITGYIYLKVGLKKM